MRLKVVATVHFANETWIIVISVFTARSTTPTSLLTSLLSIATTNISYYTYQPNICQMMVLRSSTWVFCFHSFMNHITTHFFTLPTIIPAIQKPTATMHILIEINLQFRQVFRVLHTRTTFSPANLSVTSIWISSTMKFIHSYCVPARRSID